MKTPTVGIGYVSGATVDQCFMASLYAFLEFDSRNRKVTMGVGSQSGLYIDDNRNLLTKSFLETPADYLLMIDTDVEFAPAVPYALLDDMVENDRAIEGALYFGILRNRIAPVWFDDAGNGRVQSIRKFTTGKVVPLAAIGMGFTMIRRDVLEKMAGAPKYSEEGWPWFGRDPIVVNGEGVHEGEDIGFCRRARDLGFQIWGNAKVEVNHWKRMALNFNLFRVLYEDARRRGAEY